MTPIQTSRWGGLALIVGSALFIVNKFDDMSRVFLNNTMPDLISGENVLLVGIGQVALVTGLLGCYFLYAGRCSRIGKIGLILLLSGGILLALGHVTFTPFSPDELMFLLVILGVFLMMAGLILFGAINLRLHVLEHWQTLPLATGILGFVGFVFASNQDPVIFLSLRTLFGGGLLVLGVVMLQDTHKSVVESTHTTQYAG